MSGFTEREARLIPTLINVLMAGLCDPSRLSRGRTYSRQGAVMDVHVEPGVLTGFVQGGRSVPYEVTVGVTLPRSVGPSVADNLAALVPKGRDLTFGCTCPDWEIPCKHAVAVMASFADRVGRDPSLLVSWRGLAGGTTVRAVIGSRAGREPAETEPVRLDGEAARALDTFLGGALRSTPSTHSTREVLPLLARPNGAWDEQWIAMLDDALDRCEEVGRSR